jgi:uncharacterized membrane protein (UPF0127 family)
MRRVRVVHGEAGIGVASQVAIADTWWRRMRGLLGRAPIERGEGLLILECGSVHTIGMAYPIDIAFLDADGTVVRNIGCLRPGRVGLGGPEAVHTLELPAGRLDETGIVPGVRLSWS